MIAMVLKGLPENYRTFSTVVTQREKQMKFSEFKMALRNFEETERSRNRSDGTSDENVMLTKQKFNGNCFKCGKRGHKSRDSQVKITASKWCTKCKSPTHNTKDCWKKQGDTVKKTEEKKGQDEVHEVHEFAFSLRDEESKSKRTSVLLIDSGATSHIIVDRDKFLDFDHNFNSKSHLIELADGSKANVVQGRGKAKVKLCDVNGNSQDLVLHNALYIPSYTQNIFSVPAAIDRGACVNLAKNANYLKQPDGTIFEVEQKGRLYYLNSLSSQTNANSLMDWHKIMGHSNYRDLQKLTGVVNGMNITDNQQNECAVCNQGKMCQTRNRKPDERAKTPLEFVHCDLAGPIDPTARDGFRYALCFVDDFTGIHMVYFLKQKSDTVEATQKFLADTSPFGKVKRIRSDNGGEFLSKNFRDLLIKNKIKHKASAPYSPHQNGTVERAWRSLFEMARCLLNESNLPKTVWSYAVMTAAFIRNCCFNWRLCKTPLEALTGRKPDLSNMHISVQFAMHMHKMPKS